MCLRPRRNSGGGRRTDRKSLALIAVIVDVTTNAIPIPADSFLSLVFPAIVEKLRMSDASMTGLDLTREFRLRRWARRNYVSVENRSAEWHAIVLDEMRQRELELASRSAGQTICGTFVPLPPTRMQRVDEAHNSNEERNLMHADSRQPLDLFYDSRG